MPTGEHNQMFLPAHTHLCIELTHIQTHMHMEKVAAVCGVLYKCLQPCESNAAAASATIAIGTLSALHLNIYTYAYLHNFKVLQLATCNYGNNVEICQLR